MYLPVYLLHFLLKSIGPFVGGRVCQRTDLPKIYYAYIAFWASLVTVLSKASKQKDINDTIKKTFKNQLSSDSNAGKNAKKWSLQA